MIELFTEEEYQRAKSTDFLPCKCEQCDKSFLVIKKQITYERTHKKGDVIREITIEPQTIYCRVYNSTSIADKTNLLRDTALEAMRLHGTDTTRRMYFTEYSANAPQDISYCVAVPQGSEGEYIKHLPELKALSFFHHGAYEEISEARKRLLSYADENNQTLTGVFRNIYLEGPPQQKDKSKFITQIIAIIE